MYVETELTKEDFMNPPEDPKYKTELFQYMDLHGVTTLSELLHHECICDLPEEAQRQIAYLATFLDGSVKVTRVGYRIHMNLTNGTDKYECALDENTSSYTCTTCKVKNEGTGQFEKYGNYTSFVSNDECVAIWPTV